MGNSELNRSLVDEFQANVWANYFYNLRLLRQRGYSTERLEELDLQKDLFELGGCFSKLFFKDELDKDTYSEIAKGDKKIVRSMKEAACNNDRLVLKIAHRYKNFAGSLSFEDLHAYGYTGLIRALYSFDSNKGSFSTHALVWVRQAIVRAIRDYSTEIRLPTSKFDLKVRLKQIANRLDMDLDDLSEDEVGRMSSYLGLEKGWLEERINELCIDTVSFELSNNSADPERARTSLFYILRSSLKNPEELVNIKERADVLSTALNSLNPKEKFVVRRFMSGQTLQEIGDSFGFSKERARQVEAIALEKLRRGKQLIDMVREGF